MDNCVYKKKAFFQALQYQCFGFMHKHLIREQWPELRKKLKISTKNCAVFTDYNLN